MERSTSPAGASPFHKDLFVEVDAMKGRAPTQATLDGVVTAFASAPNIYNPDESIGVHLVAELDDIDIPLFDFPHDWAEFDAVKADYFGTSRSDWIPIDRG